MANSRRGVAALLLCAVTAAGCARRPPAPAVAAAPVPRPAAAPAPAPEAREMDGTYRGTSTRYQADRRACPSPGLVTLRVLDGVFSYRWNRANSVLATVQPDGRVSGTAGGLSLTGRAVADRISGDVSNGSCAYHFTTERLS